MTEGDAISKFPPHEMLVISLLYLEAYKFIELQNQQNVFHCCSGGKNVIPIWIIMAKWLTSNNSNNKNLQIVCDDSKLIFSSHSAVTNPCSESSSAYEGLSSCVALFKGARELTCRRGTYKLTSTTAI